MATYYAWSNIRYGGKSDPNVQGVSMVTDVKMLKFGETVTADKVGLDKEGFQALIDSGAVREMKPPDMEGFSGSPIDKLREQVKLAGDAAMSIGGSYFGPSPEELLMNPDLLGAEVEDVAGTTAKK